MSATRASIWPGFAVIVAIALIAFGLHYLPFAPFHVRQDGAIRRPISPEILAIVLGVLIRNGLRLPASMGPAARWVVRNILPGTVVFIGASLDLLDMKRIGLAALVIVSTGVIVGTVSTYYIGGWLGLTPRTSLLIGAGTAICGNSAIVAVAPLVEADDRDLVLSLGTINLFGLIAMVVLPIFAGLLHWSDQTVGVWAGVAVHSVPQAIAAGYAYSAAAGAVATLTKLVRVTMLTPMVIVMALVYARRHRGEAGVSEKTSIHLGKLIPWYIWGFLAATILNTLHLFPLVDFSPDGFLAWWWGAQQVSSSKLIAELGKVLLTLSMVAIGLEVDLRALARVGGRAVFVGGIAALLLLAVSGGMSFLMLRG